MGNQHETLIPSKLNYIPSTFHKTNNNKLKLIIGFNAFIYNSGIDYL